MGRKTNHIKQCISVTLFISLYHTNLPFSTFLSSVRNSKGLLSIKFLCVTLPHMSIPSRNPAHSFQESCVFLSGIPRIPSRNPAYSFQESRVFLPGIRWKFTFVAPFCRKVCYTGFSAATDGADPETPLRAMDMARILRPCMPQNPAFSRFPGVFCHHEGGLVVPALITHYQFAQRVFSRLRQAGAPVADRDAGLIGAQAPICFSSTASCRGSRGRATCARACGCIS